MLTTVLGIWLHFWSQNYHDHFVQKAFLSGSMAAHGLLVACLICLSSALLWNHFLLFVVSSMPSVFSCHDLAELSYCLNVPLFSQLTPAHSLRMPLGVVASWKLSPDNSLLSGPHARILIALITLCWFVCVSPVCASSLCRHPSMLNFSF